MRMRQECDFHRTLNWQTNSTETAAHTHHKTPSNLHMEINFSFFSSMENLDPILRATRKVDHSNNCRRDLGQNVSLHTGPMTRSFSPKVSFIWWECSLWIISRKIDPQLSPTYRTELRNLYWNCAGKCAAEIRVSQNQYLCLIYDQFQVCIHGINGFFPEKVPPLPKLVSSIRAPAYRLHA